MRTVLAAGVVGLLAVLPPPAPAQFVVPSGRVQRQRLPPQPRCGHGAGRRRQHRGLDRELAAPQAGKGMPSYDQLEGTQLRALAAYLASLR